MHLSAEELEAGLPHVCAAPSDHGFLELIVRRPEVGEREIVEVGDLGTRIGLLGDNWISRGSSGTSDGSPHPETQLTVMNARFAGLIAGDRSRWALAGDQLYVDLDLSEANLPVGSRLAIGPTVIEVTAEPHTGCAKFVSRFGHDAMRVANSARGRTLRLRGLHARVIEPGRIRQGDAIATC